MIVGLTGGIATGKSTVSDLLMQKGLPVLDADKYAYNALKIGTMAYEKVLDYFGKEVLNYDKSINRYKLGKIIFQSEKKRQFLNSVIHPIVREQMLSDARKLDEPIIIFDIPLLFEAHFDNMCDKIVVVTLSLEKQRARLMDRDDFTYEEAILRIESQMPMAEKAAKADYVIDNNHSFSYLEEQVDDLIKKIEEVYANAESFNK